MGRMVRNLVGVKEEEGVDMKRYVRLQRIRRALLMQAVYGLSG